MYKFSWRGGQLGQHPGLQPLNATYGGPAQSSAWASEVSWGPVSIRRKLKCCVALTIIGSNKTAAYDLLHELMRAVACRLLRAVWRQGNAHTSTRNYSTDRDRKR